ncbi:hypothetical protein CCB80_10145 [Armatimonadetes bacterium Uphvl-Ar1]|nr:hypothetical protein CCB80_10145 [Armatimonadetes bacterium Uphvl-Ar1]
MIPNPWLVRGGVILGVAAVILLTVTTVNAGASPSIYNQAGREGVLMPEVIAKKDSSKAKPEIVREEPKKIYTRKVNFRVPKRKLTALAS